MKSKFLLLIILSFLSFVYSFGQDQEYSQKLLDRLYAIQNHSTNVTRVSGEHHHHDCLSLLLLEAKKNEALLTPAAKTAFKVLSTRPSIVAEVTYGTTHFLFHYTTTGTDALQDLTDASSNGTPDVIDSMAAIFEHVYLVDNTVLNYYMPPDDGTEGGGNNLFDVYIKKIGTGLYGYANTETTIGNNPNSPGITEKDAMTSWMAMNSDYTWVAQFTNITPLQAIKVTAAHEFFHAIQFGITSNSSIFFAESTAVWMEDQMYPGIDDNLQYMVDIFDNPDVALDLHENEISNFDGRWYSGWLFWRYVTEHLSTPDIIKDIWYLAIDQFENDAYNIALNNHGTDFKTMFTNWQIANYVMKSNSNYDPYTYSRADVYSQYNATNAAVQGLRIEGTLTYTGKDTTWYSDLTNPAMGNGRLMRLSGDYIAIQPNQNFNVVVIPSDINQGITPYLIKINTATDAISVIAGTLALGNQYSIQVTDAGSYDKFALLISRYDANITNDVSGSAQYTIRVGNVTPSAVLNEENTIHNLFPNPAKDQFEIDYSSLNPEDMMVVDYTGKIMLNTSIDSSTNGKQIVNSSTWNNGIYFVILKGKNGLIAKEKIVISK